MMNLIQKEWKLPLLSQWQTKHTQKLKAFTSWVDPPHHLLLFLLGFLLLFSPRVAWFRDWLYSHIRVPSQRLSSQSSNITVICILFPLQLPKVFCQSLSIYFPHHLSQFHATKMSTCLSTYRVGCFRESTPALKCTSRERVKLFNSSEDLSISASW